MNVNQSHRLNKILGVKSERIGESSNNERRLKVKSVAVFDLLKILKMIVVRIRDVAIKSQIEVGKI